MSFLDWIIKMASAVKLLSVRPLESYYLEDTYIWLCKNQSDSQYINGLDEWNPYPPAISSLLENAFRRGDSEAFIGTLYRIDFRKFLQIDIGNPQYQTLIQRQKFKLFEKTDEKTECDIARQERFLFPLNTIESDSAAIDTFYQGSQFVRDWLLKFTDGQMKVKFNVIFPALVNGLQLVGREEPEKVLKDILHELYFIEEKSLKQKEWKRMKKLQDCCAKLYTKQCFIFRIANTALRDDDRTKLDALGPYCYLVYNYIGRYTNENMSLRRRFLRASRLKNSQWITLYRGDSVCSKTIEEYKQAVGKRDVYFRWLPFVSTSIDRDVALSFGMNVLFIILLKSYVSNDQFTCLSTNTYIESEKETLLKPGTRFRVLQVEYDCYLKRELVYIKIIPSYVSNLR